MYKDLRDQGFYFITVWDDSLASQQTWLDSYGYEVTNNYQENADYVMSLYNDYHLNTFGHPQNFLIDRDGNVRKADYFADTWQPSVEELL